jgi:ferredoxin-type protein NapH
MNPLKRAGAEAVEAKGWLVAHKWLLLRRSSQLLILSLFLVSPWLTNFIGINLIKGNLTSSLTLDVLPLTDPYVLLQSVIAGHWPLATAFLGAVIIAVFYLLVGGRVYCSWVCPINIITDAAAWLREYLKIKGGIIINRNTRFWLLGFTFLVALSTASLAWELINPVSIVFRGIIFGIGLAWGMILAIFLLDFAVSRRAWCGHLCPMGAFYSLLGKTPARILHVDAIQRKDCDDCMDCFIVCPEQQVIKIPLKTKNPEISSIILSSQCTNCGRCIDVCAKNVFKFNLQIKK